LFPERKKLIGNILNVKCSIATCKSEISDIVDETVSMIASGGGVAERSGRMGRTSAFESGGLAFKSLLEGRQIGGFSCSSSLSAQRPE
jgi:hypothetical protein